MIDDRNIVRAREQEGITQRWAFLVGVNRYVDPKFSTLKFCVDDVLALEKILSHLGYTVVCLHDELDRNDPLFPTRDNVEAKLKEMCQAVQRDDLLWVHFSCHGTLVEKEENKKEPVLIVQDTRFSLLKERSLAVGEVERYMKTSGARRLVLTLDACHSGVEIGRDITDPEFIRNVYELAEGFALIAASTAQQVAFEWEEKQQGVFTGHMLEGLSSVADRSGKNFVSVDDLKNHVLDGLRRWGVKNSRIQEPTARTEGLGDIILADYRVSSKLDIEQIKETRLTKLTVRKLSKTFAIEKENLEKDLANLSAQYDVVKNQSRQTVDERYRFKLEEQAKDILQQMEQVEQKLEQLG